MTASGTSQDRNPVEALADEFLRRQRGGERPTLDEYCRRHPELADEIREVFPVLIRMEDLRSDGPDDSTGRVAVRTASRLERLGDYRILREVGRGGMGVVYEAEQESLGRRVALKVLPDAALADAQQVLRFQREARAAARLHHTNIVPVFGVGRDDGRHYYVMQFIPGMGLDAVLEELRRLRRGGGPSGPPAGRASSNGAVSAAAVAEAILTGRFSPAEGADGIPGPGTTLAATESAPLVPIAAVAPGPAESSVVSLPGASADSLARSDPDRTFFRSVARIGLQVAEALEYANRQGVLHRDVKPSNLLLDPKGNVWVADFGLAKAADAEDLTHSGDIVGTVRYMAPERFAGRCDARSDVYALGLTLYELLALRPAFSAADPHELMRRVMNEEPERLRGLVPHLPRDLETIVAKAITREPAERYVSAAALAEDLRRFLDDRPIRARRVTAGEQAWRWARRNPAVATLAAGLLAALVFGLGGVTWAWRQASANLALANDANRKAQARFGLAMEAVRAFTTGASEDVILKEQALGGLRKRLLGQSRTFYEKLRGTLEKETDRASRQALAEALFDAGSLYAKVDAPAQAIEAHRESLALREELARERPGDTAARRDLGHGQLALAGVFNDLARFDEARASLARSRAVLDPLTLERPEDGGARKLLAECESLEGDLLVRNGRPAEGREVLARARARLETLIVDHPPYTLPTTADGPTEYRRALAEVYHQIHVSLTVDRREQEAEEFLGKQRKVLEELAGGRLADDADRRRLARSYYRSGWTLYFALGRPDKSVRDLDRAVAIFRDLADNSPAVGSYKVELARCLAGFAEILVTRGDYETSRRRAQAAITALRPLSRDQKETADALHAEALAEFCLALCNSRARRTEAAMTHLHRSRAVCEAARSLHPGYFPLRELLGNILVNEAFMRVLAGDAGGALQVVGRIRLLAEPILREQPDLRYVRSALIGGELLEGLVRFRGARRAEAAEAFERSATQIGLLKPPLHGAEHFLLSGLHASFYIAGRPAGPGRPTEPPGLAEHADRAVAEIREMIRLGRRDPVGTSLIAQLIPERPELGDLVMDQVFPDDPIPPDPGSAEEDPQGPRP